MTSFAELGVRPRTASALASQNIHEPLPVQVSTIPPLLEHRDTVIEAPTGSGKTLAFLVPLVEHLGAHSTVGVRGLIVVPTRELASQISLVLRELDPQLRVALLMGGVRYGAQLRALSSHPDVVVGCPGRILDLANQGIARFHQVRYLVLDEADEMLDQGFARDVEKIIAMTPNAANGGAGRQTVLASATMPTWVQTMISRHLEDPARVRVESEHKVTLEHGLVRVAKEQRNEVLSKLLNSHPGSAIVFHRTKHGAKNLARDLARMGHKSAELQGNLSQNARDRAISDFRALKTDVLVATNVAARGLDVSHVGLVVNYELPDSAEWLTHRIGRTARNGAAGRALTFVSDAETEQWRKLRRGGAPDLFYVDQARLLEGEGMHSAGRPSAVAEGGREPMRGPARGPQNRRGGWQPRSGGRPPMRGGGNGNRAQSGAVSGNRPPVTANR